MPFPSQCLPSILRGNHWFHFFHHRLSLPILGLQVNGIIPFILFVSGFFSLACFLHSLTFCVYQKFIPFYFQVVCIVFYQYTISLPTHTLMEIFFSDFGYYEVVMIILKFFGGVMLLECGISGSYDWYILKF